MFKFTVLLACFCLFLNKNMAQVQANALQKSQLKRGYGMFIHFGVNTFNELEWSDGKLPVSSYNPDKLDCDQWIKTAKEAGFRYVILITKHHDGFCLWNSQYTDYDVAASPVTTDVVAEVAKACKKYGLQFGLYYSLWDRHEPAHKDKNPQVYVDFMKHQLTELLTNYGTICELWFDGGWAKKDSAWHISELYQHIKKLQPKCLVTVNHTIGRHEKISSVQQPVDMKENDPIRFFPVDFRTKDPNLARWDDPKVYVYDQKQYYLPFEHTLCLSDRWNWFQKKNALPVRGVDELEELFYWCTANDNILIINVPPDQHGQIREHERLRLLELADRLGIRNGKKTLPQSAKNELFNKPITATNTADNPKNTPQKANDYSLETWWTAADSTATLDIDLEKNTLFNRLVLMEYPKMIDLKDGFSKIRQFHVEQFRIDIMNADQWETIYVGSTIGASKIIHLPVNKTATKLRVAILKSSAVPSISHIAMYFKA